MAGKQLGTFSTNMSHIHIGSALDTAPPRRPRRSSSVHSGAQRNVHSKIYVLVYNSITIAPLCST